MIPQIWKSTFLTALICASLLYAEGQTPKEGGSPLEPAKPTATDKVNVKLTELFGTESSPGSGSLGYSVGTQMQQIALGKETGVYALGLVFDDLDLPASLRKGKNRTSVIQMAIGFNRSKITTQLPQFAALSVLTTDRPRVKKSFPLLVPNPGDKNRKEMAFLIFTPPTTQAERTDEDKLKTTFFATGGSLGLAPTGGEQTIDVKRDGDTMKFGVQMVEADFNAALSTPFQSDSGKLQGKIHFPVYWPANTAARKLVRKMAQDSIDGASLEKSLGRDVAKER